MKAFGLFKNIYDYYEWHDIVCVSFSEAELVAHYNQIEQAFKPPLLSGDEQVRAAKVGQVHYMIEQIEFVQDGKTVLDSCPSHEPTGE